MNTVTLPPLEAITQYVETVVISLQEQAHHHGELINALMITPEELHNCWLDHQRMQLEEYERSRFRLNLFDNTHSSENVPHEDSFAAMAWQCWVKHLQQLKDVQASSSLDSNTWCNICQWLIDCGEATGLPQRLKDALEPYQQNATASVASACLELNEFITWLGYKDVAHELRPFSRINKKRRIFTLPNNLIDSTQLRELGEKTRYINVDYIGDWLVAFRTRVLTLTPGN